LHPTTELLPTSPELLNTMAWRHGRPLLHIIRMYAPFLGKREIGDKTGNEWGNEAGGKPPAPPVQPAGGSEVGGSRTPPLKKN